MSRAQVGKGRPLPEEEPLYDYKQDSGENETDFAKKYGTVNVKYIKKPRMSSWYFTRPYPLNFFYEGTLYRTKGERGTSTIELFFDLLYSGVCVNLASSAVSNASAASFLRYILVFLPAYQVWSDVKEFMNHYFNEDLAQKALIVWFMVLLTIYGSNANFVIDSQKETAMTVIPYILCRLTLALVLFAYSFFILQHRVQMVMHGTCIVVTSLIWIAVIFVPTRTKVGLCFMLFFLEKISSIFVYHIWTVRKLKLRFYSAMNIEHEVARFFSFYTIAIGQFVSGNVLSQPITPGINDSLWRAIMILVIAFTLIWFYLNGEGSIKAVHALRRNVHTGFMWMNIHIPLIASLVLAANTSTFLVRTSIISTHKHQEALEAAVQSPSMYAACFMWTGGLCVALICLSVIALLDKSVDNYHAQVVRKEWRILPRIPAALVILVLPFSEMTVNKLIGVTMMLMLLLFLYEMWIKTVRERRHEMAHRGKPGDNKEMDYGDKVEALKKSEEEQGWRDDMKDLMNYGNGLG